MRVLMTSAQSTVDSAVSALELGADDFVPKPLNMQEFLARVAACLRRPATLLRADSISAGGITIDNIGHRVTADGSFLSLAPREYDLLLFLLNNQNRVFSRRQLLAHVWGRDAIVGPRTVDVHIRRLRNLLEPYSYAKYIQTVRGSGYRFSLER
jgi:two-component system phosphate regulon response regulator PhoB